MKSNKEVIIKYKVHIVDIVSLIPILIMSIFLNDAKKDIETIKKMWIEHI